MAEQSKKTKPKIGRFWRIATPAIGGMLALVWFGTRGDWFPTSTSILPVSRLEWLVFLVEVLLCARLVVAALEDWGGSPLDWYIIFVMLSGGMFLATANFHIPRVISMMLAWGALGFLVSPVTIVAGSVILGMGIKLRGGL